ncbi:MULTISPECIES: CAF17-like 4Fe-4S cluster assembly/insertion protein YgfZ [unclassified Sphingomonas]|uniref:CAF17-like 4Fe-4S cluster assembly/insertion protein YgfZ n=1 Tax=unclassified Sphingomonas TaxID=196159 RepID=UPI0006F32B31|nr:MULTISPECIES: folate-binding protein YgfZ [unclassified Sphingomonas]KQM57888.1 aminomethyltransferase [Sphingomonas sp. Leaf16]KQN12827.1 aminomethyltransferase [Sphingomonas sp. Leaf29]KQN19714.1 aminomethyltransferase [Sphingomonas sp. Leaf32]
MTMTTPACPPGTWLSDRAVLRVGGTEARVFLQGLVTQDMGAVTPETPGWAALLSAQGKALFDFILWADSDDILIDCEEAVADALAKRLTLYRLRRAVTIERTDIGVHWSREGTDGVADPRLAALGRRWLAPAGAAASGWPAHRLRHGVAEGRAELGDGQTLWLECNARELNGVSFTKGCYVGQENTARMNYRSTVNRRLVVVPTDVPGPRTRIVYPELGLAVEHRRIDDLGEALRPDWLATALAEPA